MEWCLEYIYPPQPVSERGLATQIDSHSGVKKLVYCVSNIVVVRSTEDLTQCTIFDQHKFETTAVRISPSGFLCASADSHGSVFVWELGTPVRYSELFRVIHPRSNMKTYLVDPSKISHGLVIINDWCSQVKVKHSSLRVSCSIPVAAWVISVVSVSHSHAVIYVVKDPTV